MLLFLAFRVQLENLKFQEKSQKNLYSWKGSVRSSLSKVKI
jgi:hypothetical protein